LYGGGVAKGGGVEPISEKQVDGKQASNLS